MSAEMFVYPLPLARTDLADGHAPLFPPPSSSLASVHRSFPAGARP